MTTAKIGVLSDMSGVYADYGGPGAVAAAKLAVALSLDRIRVCAARRDRIAPGLGGLLALGGATARQEVAGPESKPAPARPPRASPCGPATRPCVIVSSSSGTIISTCLLP